MTHALSDEGPDSAGRSQAKIQVVVVEDHPPVRQGLELLLPREGFRMIGCAAAGARMICARKPDVALVDIDLGDGSGTALAQAMINEAPKTAIVLYTASINGTVIDDAFHSLSAQDIAAATSRRCDSRGRRRTHLRL